MTPEFAVIGEGWAALHAVAFLAQAGKSVHWFPHTGARLLPPLPCLDAGIGAQVWKELAARLGIETGELEVLRTGSSLREFRNKAFREPAWAKTLNESSVEEARRLRDETLWEPEARWVGVPEARFSISLGELEAEIRHRVASLPGIRRIEGVPVTGISSDTRITLGSGEEICCNRVIFADRWAALGGISGLPKPLAFTRNREGMGVLQASFVHSEPLAVGLSEGFFGAVHKESGEEFQRNIWGYFFDEGKRSVWTLILSQTEVEDNHEIAKKFRRMKQTLDRMFTGSEWLQGKPDFMSTVRDELVRFEEAVVFSKGEAPKEPITLPKNPSIAFVTDGYGPASAAEQVYVLLGAELGIQV